MSSAGLRVTDEANVRMGDHGPGPALVGRSAGASGSLNRPVGAVDFLTVWYSDSTFTMLGWTVQMDSERGGTQLLKSTTLRDLEQKLARECRGYLPGNTDPR
jgi:hypothetical protein